MLKHLPITHTLSHCVLLNPALLFYRSIIASLTFSHTSSMDDQTCHFFSSESDVYIVIKLKLFCMKFV